MSTLTVSRGPMDRKKQSRSQFADFKRGSWCVAPWLNLSKPLTLLALPFPLASVFNLLLKLPNPLAITSTPIRALHVSVRCVKVTGLTDFLV